MQMIHIMQIFNMKDQKQSLKVNRTNIHRIQIKNYYIQTANSTLSILFGELKRKRRLVAWYNAYKENLFKLREI